MRKKTTEEWPGIAVSDGPRPSSSGFPQIDAGACPAIVPLATCIGHRATIGPDAMQISVTRLSGLPCERPPILSPPKKA